MMKGSAEATHSNTTSTQYTTQTTLKVSDKRVCVCFFLLHTHTHTGSLGGDADSPESA